ncbi:uncharacterized protein [Procambarus clarkii]|uniref:uncharacterized protein isoform X1 n=2 Tax=Procambarus clarkii TaxID=6728 RepID=UPI00374439B4
MWTQDNTPEIMLEAETIQDENKFEENVKKKRSRRRRRGRNPAEDSTSGPSTLQPTATDVKSELPLQNEEENKLEGHVKKKRSRRRRRGKYPTEDSTTPGPAQDQSIISVEGNKDGCLTEISASSNTDGISAVSSAINTNDENSIVKSSNTEKKKRRRNRRKRPMSSQGGGDNELALENVGSSQLVNEGNLNVEGIGNGKIEVKDFDDIDGNSGAGCASVATDAGEQSLVMSSSTERKKRRRRNKRRRASASQGNGEVETQSTNDVNSNMTNLDGVNATHDTSLNINNFDGIQSINVVNSTMINMDGMQNVGAINSECNLNVSTADGMEVQERRRAKRRNRKRNKKRASTTEGDDVAQMSETVTSIEPTIVSDQPAKKRRRKRKRNNSVPVDMAEAANVTNEENAEISDGNMKKIKLSPNDDVLPTEENIGGSVSSQQKKNKRNRNRRRRAKKDFKDKQDNNAESIIDSQENGDGILKAADSDLKDGEETSGKFNTEGDMDDTKDECCTTQPLQQANNNQTNKRKRKRNRRRKGKQSVVESESDAQTPGVTHTGETPHNGTESAHLSEEGISRVFDEEFDSPAVKKMRKDDQISTSIINGSAAPATVELAAVYADEEYKNKIKKHWSEGKGQFCEDTGLEVIKEPFTCCYLPNFLKNEDCLKGVVEELQDMQFIMKSNDLYKFSQTCDLKKALTPHITGLKNFLYGDFRNWLIDMTGIPLTDTVDMSCSRYMYTDVLLCHDDELDSRRIAYILYLVPPWEEQDGGSLDLFNTDEHKQPKDVVRSLQPKWNGFAFFEVSPVSFHQVAEVLTQEKVRLSINGWFHGPPVERPAKYIAPRPLLEAPVHIEEEELYSWINPTYLDMNIQKEIRHKFRADSEIELESFLAEDKYNELAEALKQENLNWTRTGPANKQFFEVLTLDQVPDIIVDCLKFLKSEALFLIVSQLTGLTFHKLAPSDSEPESNVEDAKESCPRVSIDVQRWSHGCYTLLRDDLENKCALDANLFVNVSSQWSQQHGGFISYIAKNVDEELLTVMPQPNRFALVYRDVETACFTKHINTSVCQLGERDSTYNNFACVFYE